MTNESIPYGFCQCGCGLRTALARDTNDRWGYVAGEPVRFRVGHHHRKRSHTEESPRLCACGCGELTNVYQGRAKRYVHGHNAQIRVLGENDYTVEDRGYVTPCWIWSHCAKNKLGYGGVQIRKRKMYAHRAMYLQVVGEIPAGLELDHLCRVPACVRPDHLEPVTHLENVRRGMRARGVHSPTDRP